jgi:hypothetical protein
VAAATWLPSAGAEATTDGARLSIVMLVSTSFALLP